MLQPSPLVWIDGVVLTSQDGTVMWQIALDRQVVVGEWTTVRVAAGSARATNKWGATTNWSGAAPWNNVHVAVTRRTLFGTPSLSEVPIVRNIRLTASLQPGKAVASYVAASPMTLRPQLGNDLMTSSGSHFTWKALNDYSQCVVAPSCVEVNMTEYFLNLTTATPASDGSGSDMSPDVLELDPTLFPPSNTEVRRAIACLRSGVCSSTPCPQYLPMHKSGMGTGTPLHAGEALRSQDGRFEFAMQKDGNLALCVLRALVWL